jgi:hypothetical protein
MTIHLVKLCVGVESFEHLQTLRDAQSDGPHTSTRHVTRMWPKRAEELLDGGSLYWVIKGVVQARQRISALEEVIGADGIRRCAIVMEPTLIRTQSAPRRAFQGWRYLAPDDAPPDLRARSTQDDDLPDHLATALGEIGLL